LNAVDSKLEVAVKAVVRIYAFAVKVVYVIVSLFLLQDLQYKIAISFRLIHVIIASSALITACNCW
jgi:hypothetical protein